MIIATVEKGLDVFELNSDLKKQYEVAAKLWDNRDLLRVSKIITDLEPQVKRAVQPHILLELSLLKLLELDSVVTIESLINKFQNPSLRIGEAKKEKETSISNKANIVQPKTDNTLIENPKPDIEKIEVKTVYEPTPKPITSNNIDLDSINEKWDEFIEELSSERPSIGNVLSHCEVGQFAGNRLEIKFVNGNNFNYRTLEKNKLVIENYLEKTYGSPIKTALLKTKPTETKTVTKDIKKENEKTNNTTAKIIELFDGEILN